MLPLGEEVPDNGKPESCKTCPLYSSTEGIVWGTGPTNAKMMFVGEAPGEDEGVALVPFVGGSGRVFTKMLEHARIDRREVFITNTVKCRPTAINRATGAITNRQPTDSEIKHCARFLLDEIKKVNPNTIVALGNIPMKTITGTTKGIMLSRSVPTEGNNRTDGKAPRYKVVGTLHPAYIMRQQNLWPLAIFDLVRARLESASPLITRRPWKNVIHARLQDVGEHLYRTIRESGWYGHDLETTGLDWRRDAFRCVGLAGRSDEVFVFDWTGDVAAFVGKLHSDPSLTVVGQNSEGFDIPFQEGKGYKFAWEEGKRSFDTLLGFHLLNSGLPKDLATIGASCTDELYWKDDTMYKSGEDALQTGCGKDVHATCRGFEDQVQEMQQLGQESLYYNHIMPVQPVLRNMTRRGLKKDMRTAAGWSLVLQRKADEYDARLRKGLGDPGLDINSNKQLMDLLYTRMQLPVQYKRNAQGEFRPTVDADALDALAMISKNPILTLVRSIRTLRKWDSTFVNCDHDENFFVHGHFSTAKAANGRLNSFDPNMQNFPVDVRVILVPDSEDHVLIARDWGQIEWRIAMALAGDKVGLQALVDGRDAHKDAYAQAFGAIYEEVTKAERDIAKAVNYGLLYGRGAKSVAAGRPGHPEDVIPLDHVETYISKFLAKFEGYGRYRRELEHQVRRHHFVASAWGRRRYWYTTQNMPEAYNHPISSTAASMMYEAIVEMEAQLPPGATLRLTVHDELVVNAPKDQKTLQQTIDCMESVMQRPFSQVTEASLYPEVVKHFYPQGWFCPSDSNMGMTWRATKGKFKSDLAKEAELKKTLGVTL